MNDEKISRDNLAAYFLPIFAAVFPFPFKGVP